MPDTTNSPATTRDPVRLTPSQDEAVKQAAQISWVISFVQKHWSTFALLGTIAFTGYQTIQTTIQKVTDLDSRVTRVELLTRKIADKVGVQDSVSLAKGTNP